MMQRGYLRWTPSKPTPDHHQLTALRGVPTPQVADLMPTHDSPLSIRDEAVFLLHLAAAVEHSLLVQYLYASFSIVRPDPDDPADPRSSWRKTIRKIAIEEMGHLIGVQNLLLVLGASLAFERDTFPFRSPFYPFPFHLEPLTRDSLARYIAAEMPVVVPDSKRLVIAEIVARATRSNMAMPVNQVGRLYAKLIDLFGTKGFEQYFRPETADRFQSDPKEWDQHSDYNLTFAAVKTPQEAIDKVLKPIAEQGEGPIGGADAPDPKSHFARFLSIYEGVPKTIPPYPETNPRYGPVVPRATWTVPTNPSTDPAPLASPDAEDNRITGNEALPWAQLFNLRYRKLLAFIAHSLRVDKMCDPQCRANLITWALRGEMRLLGGKGGIADQLARLPRQSPNLFEDGAPAVAGAPFELPYTLDLPDRDSDRWALHLDLIEASRLQVAAVKKAIQEAGPQGHGDPDGTLSALKTFDEGDAKAGTKGVESYVKQKYEHPQMVCDPA